jgi:hypothetical protein
MKLRRNTYRHGGKIAFPSSLQRGSSNCKMGVFSLKLLHFSKEHSFFKPNVKNVVYGRHMGWGLSLPFADFHCSPLPPTQDDVLPFLQE